MNEHSPIIADGLQNRVHEVIQAVVRRRISGEVLTDEGVLAEFPELADQLASELPKLRLIQNAAIRADAIPVSETVTAWHDGTPHTPGHMRIRCPFCRESFETPADTAYTDITCQSCGSSFSLARSDDDTRSASALETLGHFELVERIGMGGFGTVWKGRDTKLDRTVAIKLPRQGMLEPAEVEKFLREARAAAQLKHPNIVSVHEVGRHGDTLYIVSDYVRGITLSDWLTGQRPTAREAAELCIKIAEALHHAHEQGVIHRDLKPHNIMIDGAGEPHLMDFGLARRDMGEVTMTVEGQVLGTPAYMSPEQARGEGHTADRRSDVYSLGVILFELLTGERPFRGNAQMLMHSVINDEPPSPRKLSASVPRDLETITLKCLEKEPSRRYQAARALASDLRRFLNDEPIVASPPSTVDRLAKFIRRNKTASISAALIAITLVGGTTVSTWQTIQATHARREVEAFAAREIKLLRHTDAREKISLAQSLCEAEEFEQADNLIRKIPAEFVELEAADIGPVFHALGHWHAGEQRWHHSAAYYDSFLFGPASRIVASLEVFVAPSANPGIPTPLPLSLAYLEYAPLLLELDDRAGYEKLREAAIARYSDSSIPGIAERMLFVCLLSPADKAQLIVCRNWGKTASEFKSTYYYASIALLEYRRGNFDQTLEWSEKCLSLEAAPALATRVRVLKSMAYAQLHKPDQAETELAMCRDLIEAKFEGELGMGSYGLDLWADWLISRILLREAEVLRQTKFVP